MKATPFLFTLCLTIFAIAGLTHSQDGDENSDGDWNWTLPVPSNTITDFHIINGSTAMSVGKSGTILKTKDRGNTWVHLKSGTRNDLTSVNFTGANLGIVAGAKGTLLITNNCGETFTTIQLGWDGGLRGSTWFGPNTGVVVGEDGAIFRSTDGGVNWTPIPSPTGLPLNGVYGFNDWGYAVGDSGIVLKSTDAGATWTPRPVNTDCQLWAGATVDSFGFSVAGAGGKIFNTPNDGTDWNPLNSGVNKTLRRILWPDSLRGIAVGDSGTFITTTDGGNTWTPLPPDPSCDFLALALDDSFGVVGGTHGKISTSGGFGKPFNPIPRPPLFRFTDLAMFNPDTGFGVTTDGEILGTFNGGLNFGSVFLSDVQLEAICRADEKNWWAAGGTFGDSAKVFHSGDGGLSWEPQLAPSALKLFDICFKDSLNGTAVGLSGVILCTKDGGKTWQKKNSPTNEWLLSVDFVGDSIWVAAGGNGTIIRSVDFGESWNSINGPTNEWLTSVDFLDDSLGFGCGNQGTILRTEDGGQNWDRSNFDGALEVDFVGIESTVSFTGLEKSTSFQDTDILVTAVGQLGTIFHSNDAGLTWTQQDSKTKNNLTAVSYANANTVFAVGDVGTVIRRVDSGPATSVEWQAAQIPETISLRQNYPNPFNPTTTIEFKLTREESVSLKIFDILGREVVTLLNASLSPGTHKSTFDGSGLASGIYFYRLQTSSFTRTKKLALLK